MTAQFTIFCINSDGCGILDTIVFLTTENTPRNCGREKCISVAHNMPPMVIATDGISTNITQLPPSIIAQPITVKPRITPNSVAKSIASVLFRYLL